MASYLLSSFFREELNVAIVEFFYQWLQFLFLQDWCEFQEEKISGLLHYQRDHFQMKILFVTKVSL